MTIAYAAISQKKLIINKDTLVTYTNDQNRKIAILILGGDSKEELIKNYEKENIILYETINRIENLNMQLVKINVLQNKVNKDITLINERLKIENQEINKKSNLYKKIVGGSISINIILLIILL